MKILQGKQKKCYQFIINKFNIYLKAKACKIFQELFTLFFFKEILIYSTVIYMS